MHIGAVTVAQAKACGGGECGSRFVDFDEDVDFLCVVECCAASAAAEPLLWDARAEEGRNRTRKGRLQPVQERQGGRSLHCR